MLSLAAVFASSNWTGPQTWPQLGGRLYEGGITWNQGNYWIASTYSGGWFKSGQTADIQLSGYGFNNASGPLNVYHSGYVATDGTHLLLSDPNQNRILIWNELPTSNVAPDLVLGQQNFTGSLSGGGLDQLNWPLGISTDGKKLVVADAENNRVLIWNTFPTRNDQPADLQIACCQWFGLKNGLNNPNQNWPWAVWTNGSRLVVTATQGGYVFIWNKFPTQNNQRPDIYLTGTGLGSSRMGTPRSIISNGQQLIVTDENAALPTGGTTSGTWFWNRFPNANVTAPSFVLPDPTSGTSNAKGNTTTWGTITPDGKLILAGFGLYIYNSIPTSARPADLVVGTGCDLYYTGLYRFCFGDPGKDVTYAGGRLYVSLGYGSKMVVFNTVPTSATAIPDFAIGAADAYVNTDWQNSIIVNPNPASDGQSLLALSDYYSTMHGWLNLPDQSGAAPDVSYDNPACATSSPVHCYSSNEAFEPEDTYSLYNGTFVGVGHHTLWIWKESDLLSGAGPSAVYTSNIGSVALNGLQDAVAMDAHHFYLAGFDSNKVYIWNGLPGVSSNPAFALDITQPSSLATDGNYLVVGQIYKDQVSIYPLSSLSASTVPTVVTLTDSSGFGGKFQGIPAINGVYGVAAGKGHLFVVDGGNNRVLAWKNISDAINGLPPDTVLGQPNLSSTSWGNGPAQLSYPDFVSWDGTYLWVGEFKFESYLVRYSSPSLPGSQVFSLSVDRSHFSVGANTADTVSDLSFNPSLRALRYTVNATSQGSTTLLIPSRLLNGPLAATVDGATAPVAFQAYNSTHASATLSYAAGVHKVQVTGASAFGTFGPSTATLTVGGPGLVDPFSSQYTINPHSSLSPYFMNSAGALSLSASVTPPVSDGNLTIQYQVGAGMSPAGPFGEWTTLASSSTGSLAYSWMPGPMKTYELRAVWSGDANHHSSYSSVFVLETGQFQTTTSTSTTVASTSTAVTSAGQTLQPHVNLSPGTGPNGTFVTIAGNGLSPNHQFAYCYQSGSPPPPPTPPSPCPAGSLTFMTGPDGNVPATPPVTLEILGIPGQYTVKLSDPSGPFVLPLNFVMTPTNATQSASSTSTSSTGGAVPEFPTQLLATTIFTILLLASYLVAKQGARPRLA